MDTVLYRRRGSKVERAEAVAMIAEQAAISAVADASLRGACIAAWMTGVSAAQISGAAGVARTTFYRWLHEAGVTLDATVAAGLLDPDDAEAPHGMVR